MRVSQDTQINGTPLAVLLPGSGSDEVFLRTAVAPPLCAIGLTVRTTEVSPGRGVVQGYLRALDLGLAEAADRSVPLLVGGISLGAQVAARWAAGQVVDGSAPAGLGGSPGAVLGGSPGRVVGGSPGRVLGGLLLGLPAWTGQPGTAPAAVAAAITAEAVRRDGLPATIETTRAQTPRWLGDELARAWARHGAGLAGSLEVAAATPGPSESDLARLSVPVGLVGLRDDPVHPLRVAQEWHRLLPRSALVTTTLGALGSDWATLGRALALAWLRACALPAPDRSPA